MHGDNEFNIADLRDEIRPAELIVYAKEQHVPIIERLVQTVKERCQCACHAAPYKKYTKLMIQHLVESRVMWLNRFPSSNGISKTMSPATIVTGQPKPDMSKKRISFGSYAMVYTSTTNTMKSRSVPAIALSESNKIGGSYFMLLYTGKLIHGFDWNEIPIHDDVIDTVEQLSTNEKQPMLICKWPLFEWRPGVEIPDVADDELDNAEIVEVANEVAEEIDNNVGNDNDSVDNEQRADVDGFVMDNDEASVLDARDNENDQDNDDGCN